MTPQPQPENVEVIEFNENPSKIDKLFYKVLHFLLFYAVSKYKLI